MAGGVQPVVQALESDIDTLGPSTVSDIEHRESIVHSEIFLTSGRGVLA